MGIRVLGRGRLPRRRVCLDARSAEEIAIALSVPWGNGTNGEIRRKERFQC